MLRNFKTLLMVKREQELNSIVISPSVATHFVLIHALNKNENNLPPRQSRHSCSEVWQCNFLYVKK